MFRERFYISDRTEDKNNDEVMKILDRRITSETIAQLQALRTNSEQKFDPDKRMI